ncbi:hypothetical protein J4228_05085 [Candidatus Woesearchaeota archaeon]|nr:hypothetical protein [Candidatus Woesearchaeota archaeon]
MAKEKSMGMTNRLGSWSFLVGVVLAVLLGLGLTGAYQPQVLWVVFLLGVVVGLLNITSTEVSAFLTSGTVLVLLKGVLTLFVPATMIVALKAVFVLAKQ